MHAEGIMSILFLLFAFIYLSIEVSKQNGLFHGLSSVPVI